QVGPFVSVESDAVAGAVRQAGHFVVGAEAGIGDRFARGRVHGFAGSARFGGAERRVLGFTFQIPNLALARGGLAKNHGASDVGLVALYCAAIVDQNVIAFTKLLRCGNAVYFPKLAITAPRYPRA